MLQIELARREKGWSQQQLGDVARIHQSFVSQVERGTGLPTPNQRERLALVLGLPPERLLQPVPSWREVVEPAEPKASGHV